MGSFPDFKILSLFSFFLFYCVAIMLLFLFFVLRQAKSCTFFFAIILIGDINLFVVILSSDIINCRAFFQVPHCTSCIRLSFLFVRRNGYHESGIVSFDAICFKFNLNKEKSAEEKWKFFSTH